jgi:hypothetical protein
LKELNDKYRFDGVWVDGECWSLEPDYQPAAKSEFTKKTGITKIPESPDNPDFKAYLEFNRRNCKNLDHYITALHIILISDLLKLGVQHDAWPVT